jgi:hypothetical protein
MMSTGIALDIDQQSTFEDSKQPYHVRASSERPSVVYI